MTLNAKSLVRPDAARDFPHGTDAWVEVGEQTVGRMDFGVGWRWSNDLAPMFGTTSCPVRHTGYVLDGALHVELDDGTGLDLSAGDVFEIPAGHDAWVLGDRPCRILDWSKDAARHVLPVAAATSTRVGGGS